MDRAQDKGVDVSTRIRHLPFDNPLQGVLPENVKVTAIGEDHEATYGWGLTLSGYFISMPRTKWYLTLLLACWPSRSAGVLGANSSFWLLTRNAIYKREQNRGWDVGHAARSSFCPHTSMQRGAILVSTLSGILRLEQIDGKYRLSSGIIANEPEQDISSWVMYEDEAETVYFSVNSSEVWSCHWEGRQLMVDVKYPIGLSILELAGSMVRY